MVVQQFTVPIVKTGDRLPVNAMACNKMIYTFCEKTTDDPLMLRENQHMYNYKQNNTILPGGPTYLYRFKPGWAIAKRLAHEPRTAR